MDIMMRVKYIVDLCKEVTMRLSIMLRKISKHEFIHHLTQVLKRNECMSNHTNLLFKVKGPGI